jgi:hypothetical protein
VDTSTTTTSSTTTAATTKNTIDKESKEFDNEDN